jgi:hypothetical protein
MGCETWRSGNDHIDHMVREMDEENQARIAAILQRSAELTERTEELLSEPRPVMTYEPPRQVKTYDAERLEQQMDVRLKAIEARLSLRIDALEGRFQSMLRGVEGLADEAGTATGELEKKLRDEMRKEIETLRSEVTLLRAQKGSTPQGRKTGSRAPWRDIGDALRN